VHPKLLAVAALPGYCAWRKAIIHQHSNLASAVGLCQYNTTGRESQYFRQKSPKNGLTFGAEALSCLPQLEAGGAVARHNTAPAPSAAARQTNTVCEAWPFAQRGPRYEVNESRSHSHLSALMSEPGFLAPTALGLQKSCFQFDFSLFLQTFIATHPTA